MKTKTVAWTVTFLLIATHAVAIAGTASRATASMVYSLGGDTQAQELAVTVSAHNPPVTIPSTGGSFDYTVGIDNVGRIAADFQTWTLLEYPDGTLVGPLEGPFDFLVPAVWSTSTDLSQALSADAPAGTYLFHVYAGQYPGNVAAEDTFSFDKEEATPAWYAQTSGTNHQLFAPFFLDENTGWIAGNLNTMLHTTDGGNNWYPQPIPPSVHYYDLYFVDALEGWAVGTNGKIAHTEDGGESWTFQYTGTDYDFYGVHFVDDSTGWAVGGEATGFYPARWLIKRTTDGGDTWVTQLAESYRLPFNDVYFVDASHGWAVGGYGAVMHTADGGATWTEQTTPSSGELKSVFFLDSLNGWIAGGDGTLKYTINGGATWQEADIDTTASLTDVMFVDSQNGWVVGGEGGDGAIFRTRDGGATWYAQDASESALIYGAFFTDVNNGWASGYNGSLVHTVSGGD